MKEATHTSTSNIATIERLQAEIEKLLSEKQEAEQKSAEAIRAINVSSKEVAYNMIKTLGLTDVQAETIKAVGMKEGWKFVGRVIAGWSLDRLVKE